MLPHMIKAAGPKKAPLFKFRIPGGLNIDIAAAAIQAGWGGKSKLVVIITDNVGSASVGSPSLTLQGAYPNGVELEINPGVYVVGRGGLDTTGGPAILATAPFVLRNKGVIGGGGGSSHVDNPGAGFPVQAPATITHGAPTASGREGAGPGSAGAQAVKGGGGGLGARSGASVSTRYRDSDTNPPDTVRISTTTSPAKVGGAAVMGFSLCTPEQLGEVYGALNP